MQPRVIPIEIGEVITGGAVGKIIESKCPKFNVGDIIEEFYHWLAKICKN